MELFRFKSAPGVLALIRKGFTMAQNVPWVILYISAVENFKNSNFLFKYTAKLV
jgi:hypothetical protein